MPEKLDQKTINRRITTYSSGSYEEKPDHLAVEEPLLIQVHKPGVGIRNLAVMMRTPGNDIELAIGFCYTEGIIHNYNDIIRSVQHDEPDSTVTLYLKDDVILDLDKMERHFYASSSCGVCGKSAIENIHQIVPYLLPKSTPEIDPDVLFHMKEKFVKAQPNFLKTGGIHATGIFDVTGKLLACREDVGRHNAMDKLIGYLITEHTLPLSNHILMISGRASFEQIQKSLMAGVSVVLAIGAPSSLAVELSHAHNQTLIGFLKDHTYNIYSGALRMKKKR